MRLAKTVFASAALVSALAGAAIAVGAGPANASGDLYGAIALSQQTGDNSNVVNYGSTADAQNAALALCAPADCQVVVIWKNGCGALAANATGDWGWGWAPTSYAAERQALDHTPGGNANLVSHQCTTGSQ